MKQIIFLTGFAFTLMAPLLVKQQFDLSGTQSKVPIEIVYSGDLSLDIENVDKIEIDSCSKRIKWYYDIIVKNNGNKVFVFDVNFLLNGKKIAFHDLQGSTINGKLKVWLLRIDETRKYKGYIETGFLAPNSESNTINFKGYIAEAPYSETKPFKYTFGKEIDKDNNVKVIPRIIPHFIFHKYGVEDLPLITPESKVLCGYGLNSVIVSYTWVAWFPDQSEFVTIDIGGHQLSAFYGGCLPVSGKPYFYIRSHENWDDRYMIPGTLGLGVCKMVEARPDNDLLRRWVFTEAPEPHRVIIYNVALGPNYCLRATGNSDLAPTHEGSFRTLLLLTRIESPSQLKEQERMFSYKVLQQD